MHSSNIKALLVLLCVALGGCAAAFVPYTPDPYKKLSNARELLREDRPYPAERLMREAIDGFLERKDYRGLGTAQMEYSKFLTSAWFRDWPHFQDRYKALGGESGVAQEARSFSESAVSSFDKALNSLDPLDSWGLSNVHMLVAMARVQLQENSAACSEYSKSLEYHLKARAKDPSSNYYVLAPYHSYEEMIAGEMAKAGCAKAP
jgi:hypothetical protein